MIVVLELSPVANSRTHDVEEPKIFLSPSECRRRTGRLLVKKRKNFSMQKVLQSSSSSKHMISQKLKIFCMCVLLAAVGQRKGRRRCS